MKPPVDMRTALHELQLGKCQSLLLRRLLISASEKTCPAPIRCRLRTELHCDVGRPCAPSIACSPSLSSFPPLAPLSLHLPGTKALGGPHGGCCSALSIAASCRAATISFNKPSASWQRRCSFWRRLLRRSSRSSLACAIRTRWLFIASAKLLSLCSWEA